MEALLRERISKLHLLSGVSFTCEASAIQDELSRLSASLPPYHLRQLEQQLKECEAKFREQEKGVKKFSFSNKKTIASQSGTAENPPQVETSAIVKAEQAVSHRPDLSFSCRCDDVIVVASKASALTLQELSRCRVFVTVVVQSSVAIRNCTDCEFHFRAKQVRVFESRNCSFYVASATPPIIEKSCELKFGPYRLVSEASKQLGDLQATSTESMPEDCHRQVKDFNWLRTDQKSPNWCEISELPDIDQEMKKLGLWFST